MSTPTHSADAAAERYGHSRAYVLRRAREGHWPHLRVGRSVRFTDAHFARIDAMHDVKVTAKKAAEDSWGRKTRRAS